jgi:competence protein ComEA
MGRHHLTISHKEGAMIARVVLGVLLSIGLAVGGALPRAAAEAPAAAVATVNINTASKAELMRLKGVGREVAEKIIEYRETNGPFKRPEEIRRVRGVGRGIWEANRDAIVVK